MPTAVFRIAATTLMLGALFPAVSGARQKSEEYAVPGGAIYYDQNGHEVAPQRLFDVPPAVEGGVAAFSRHIYYPPWERSLRIGGVVHVFLSLDSAGKVLESRVVDSTRPKFNNTVLAAARLAKWRPAMKNQAGVPIKFTFPVHFVPPPQHS